MSSSPISHSEARDLLHKLITESTNVEGVLDSSNGFRAFVSGKVHAAPDGSILVIGGEVPTSPFIAFNPARSVSIRYGDERAVRGREGVGADLFRREFASGITFLFEDGSSAALFETKVPE